jgi:hypothetical protein
LFTQDELNVIFTLLKVSRNASSWVPHHAAAANPAGAAEQEAARVAALSRGYTQVVNNLNIEQVASLLDEDDDDDVGLRQIMLGMTRNPLRDQQRNQD